jgi:hypothetical protein
MDILLSLSSLGLFTIGYGTLTGLTLFDDKYQIQDLNKLFITDERKEKYNDYNSANFTVAIVILLGIFFLFIFVKIRSNINKTIFYIFSFFLLISSAVYFIISGFLMFKFARLNANNISNQAILNWSYALILIIYSIIIILQGKGYQKSSSSGLTNSSSASEVNSLGLNLR